MNPVSSLDDIQGFIKRIKEQKKEYLTNFFLDPARMQLWIKLGIIDFQDFGETIFLIRRNTGFMNLFFISSGINKLSENLRIFLNKYPYELFIADIVGKRPSIDTASLIFKKHGFSTYTNLLRMSRIVTPDISEQVLSLNTFYGTRSHADEINNILYKFFDPYAEQLPLMDELVLWIDNHSILIYSDDQKTIQGFVIFELIGQTSYLRYWFVHPEHREKHIGSVLLRRFFFDSRNTKRQIFWVIESNDNAIKRYLHYGYRPEEMYDIVLINKNLQYEGKDN
jgi:GNAT superfamily N-acetyltransferase